MYIIVARLFNEIALLYLMVFHKFYLCINNWKQLDNANISIQDYHH